ELMEDTEWDRYGVGKYEKCADCMVHCGFEGTATRDSLRHPLKMMRVARKGVRTDGPMAPDIDLANQRPAEYVFSSNVDTELARIEAVDPEGFKRSQRAR